MIAIMMTLAVTVATICLGLHHHGNGGSLATMLTTVRGGPGAMRGHHGLLGATTMLQALHPLLLPSSTIRMTRMNSVGNRTPRGILGKPSLPPSEETTTMEMHGVVKLRTKTATRTRHSHSPGAKSVKLPAMMIGRSLNGLGDSKPDTLLRGKKHCSLRV